MEQYLFFGRVYPERADVHLSETTFESSVYNMDISIYASQIFAIVEADEEFDVLETLRNEVKRNVQRLTDIMAFSHGHAYTSEITGVQLPDGNQRVFGVNIPSVAEQIEEEDSRSEVADAIFKTYSVPQGEYIRRSLRDLRLAMREAEDTGFFIYRSIESIRQYIKREEDIEDEGESWVRLREFLDVDRESLDFVKEFADEPRHGGRVPISDDERGELLAIGWVSIDAFQQRLLERHL